MKQREDGEEDNNILAVIEGEEAVIDGKLKEKLTEFVSHVFDHIEKKKVDPGEFRGREEAVSCIRRCSVRGHELFLTPLSISQYAT